MESPSEAFFDPQRKCTKSEPDFSDVQPLTDQQAVEYFRWLGGDLTIAQNHSEATACKFHSLFNIHWFDPGTTGLSSGGSSQGESGLECA